MRGPSLAVYPPESKGVIGRPIRRPRRAEHGQLPHLLTDWWRRERRHAAWEAACEPDPAPELADSPLFRRRAWAKLTRRQQQLLWLAYVEEFSHAEIAGICGVAPASVRVLLSRGRALLASALAQDIKDPAHG